MGLCALSVRAGIIVTGTEVLSGLIRDANGPWLSEALRAHGVVVSHIVVVGDRPDDLRAALDFLAGDLDLVVTSGGLGPTADDLTAEVVAAWAGATMEHDPALEERIWAIVARLRKRIRGRTSRCGRGAQAGACPGRSGRAGAGRHGSGVPRRALRRRSRCCPDRRGSCRRCGRRGPASPLRELLASAGTLEQRILRFFPLPEPQIAATLRELDADSLPLEITTCLRRGELEVATVFAPSSAAAYAAFEAELRSRHGDVLFSDDGATIDEVIARCSPAGRSRPPSPAPAG